MGTFEKIRNFMGKPTGESLRNANGQKAYEELELRRAHREKEAALVDINSALGTGAITGDKLEEEVKAGHKKFGTDVGVKKLGLAPHDDDEYHIPADVEPDVSKSEEVNVDDNEKIAA